VYDSGGNQLLRGSLQEVGTPYTGASPLGGVTDNVAAKLRDESAMYYGADDRLHVADRRSCLYFATSLTTDACDTTRAPAYEKRSAFEEYRYDALGRRVLVRTRSEYACAGNCLNTFIAARNADTAHVIAATSDTSTAVLILNIITREPKLAEAFVRNSHPLRPSSITSDSAYIFYGFRYRFAREIMAVSYKKHGLKWRITYVGFPERM
jgi:hypothetical protein